MPPPAMRPGVTTALAAFASLAAIVTTIHYLELPSLLAQRKRTRKVEKRCYNDASTDEKQQYSLASFATLTSQLTLPSTYPLATDVQKNVPIYNALDFGDLTDDRRVEALKDELFHVLHDGPGVYVLKNFFTDMDVLGSANAAFASIIETELKGSDGSKGDHFAPASANSRIWNSFSKHCLQDPESFVNYYSNPLFRVVSEAYLGPAYRITTQLNVVKPGGKPQVCHRDYHLGFQTKADVARWPKPMHDASRLLTLQGAVAHSDMPLESGPTRLLPFSQGFEAGFMAYRQEEFNEYFLQNYVALPLKKGDALFFSPALFHAAGENKTSDFERSANLIQVSSAFGKPMESVDALPLVEKSWELLAEKHEREGMSRELEALVCAIAEGYPFPTNLDRRPPAPGGMAPESEQDVLKRALSEGWTQEKVLDKLTAMRKAGAA
jgi:ectoine hydroxylase-related dioxygenase (phytanoyl-CoA dioxygenase family)